MDEKKNLLQLVMVIVLLYFGQSCNSDDSNTSESMDIEGNANSSQDSDSDDSNTTDTSFGNEDAAHLDHASSMTPDADGNIYVLGQSSTRWYGREEQQPLHDHSRFIEDDSTCENASQCMDIFLLKPVQNGSFEWHTFMGAVSTKDAGHSLVMTNAGNLLLQGSSNREWDGPDGQKPIESSSAEGSRHLVAEVSVDG